MILRPYQQDCINAIPDSGSYLIQMATGLGKTVTFSQVPRKGRMLIISHREELVRQPLKYFNCTTGIEMSGQSSNGEDVVSASVQSLVRRLGKFSPDSFDVIITDECFPSGTLVDGKPIESFSVGDTVLSFNHDTGLIEQRAVTCVFINPAPDRLVRINSSIVCTPNHPIFIAERGDYIAAEKVTPGNCMLRRMRETALLDGITKMEARSTQQKWSDVLFNGLRKKLLPKNIKPNDDENKQSVCIKAHERKKPNGMAGCSGKSFTDNERQRVQTTHPRRKWQRVDETAEGVIDGAVNFQSNGRACCADGSKKDKSGTLAKSLQDRYCASITDGGYRNRRQFAPITKNTVGGREESTVFENVRVDSVEILERGRDEEYERLCANGLVYNIEVEGNNNYFADGYLVHNCHHSASPTYKKIYQHFNPRLHLGFTATPNRTDCVRLNDIYQDIIFQKDLRWGIENNYLSNIICKRIQIGYDLRNVRTQNGDYAPGELDRAMEGTADAIAEAYMDLAHGATLIFAASVRQAEEIAMRIDGAVAVTANTKDRDRIIKDFTDRKIPCLVNCMIFTEGTDIPLIETIIIARPTQSDSLYTQMVGRGLRKHPDKEELLLIDCVGITGKASLCTAPSLLGIDIKEVPEDERDSIEGYLFDLPLLAEKAGDTPTSWIKNIEIVNLWARHQKYSTHDVSWFLLPDGKMVCNIKDGRKLVIPPADELGNVTLQGKRMSMQVALDIAYCWLKQNAADESYIWNLRQAGKWGNAPATDKQKAVIARQCKGININALTKQQASLIINRIMGNKSNGEVINFVDGSARTIPGNAVVAGGQEKASVPIASGAFAAWRKARSGRSSQP